MTLRSARVAYLKHAIAQSEAKPLNSPFHHEYHQRNVALTEAKAALLAHGIRTAASEPLPLEEDLIRLIALMGQGSSTALNLLNYRPSIIQYPHFRTLHEQCDPSDLSPVLATIVKRGTAAQADPMQIYGTAAVYAINQLPDEPYWGHKTDTRSPVDYTGSVFREAFGEALDIIANADLITDRLTRAQLDLLTHRELRRHMHHFSGPAQGMIREANEYLSGIGKRVRSPIPDISHNAMESFLDKLANGVGITVCAKELGFANLQSFYNRLYSMGVPEHRSTGRRDWRHYLLTNRLNLVLSASGVTPETWHDSAPEPMWEPSEVPDTENTP